MTTSSKQLTNVLHNGATTFTATGTINGYCLGIKNKVYEVLWDMA